MGQVLATANFYFYGKEHCTKTGWEKHSQKYEKPDLLTQQLDLSEKVFLITGANSGVGREVAQFLANKGATVYMLCRSRDRAEAARAEIASEAGSSKVHVLIGDVGLEEDVRGCWRQFQEHQGSDKPRLDGLMCNAGALLNERTLTKEGVEVTFASHLLFGTYLLGSLAMPLMATTPGSRMIVISSGGMYNTRFPDWRIATSASPDPRDKYDGQIAYARAKRGQVLLCERWAAEQPAVKVVSCHPGWVLTPGVQEAYGDKKKYLEPMRNTWEGAEGMIWLCVAPAEKLEGGAFYLDRMPQTKHLAGCCMSEGSRTKNSKEEVDAMMRNLEDWANGKRPKAGAPEAPASAVGA